MNKKNFIIILLISLINACSNAPTHLIIAPELHTPSNLVFNNKNTQLTVIDMRTASHIVQILKEDEAATLMSSQKLLEKTIQKTLSDEWKKQGLSVASIANNAITITIEKAIISVTQQTMNYQSQTEIILKVAVNNGDQTLTSTFKNRGNSKGPLQADIAVLERNFNRRLSTLIDQILTNEKIHNFIQ
jgi:uncharacterized lipoprotein